MRILYPAGITMVLILISIELSSQADRSPNGAHGPPGRASSSSSSSDRPPSATNSGANSGAYSGANSGVNSGSRSGSSFRSGASSRSGSSSGSGSRSGSRSHSTSTSSHNSRTRSSSSSSIRRSPSPDYRVRSRSPPQFRREPGETSRRRLPPNSRIIYRYDIPNRYFAKHRYGGFYRMPSTISDRVIANHEGLIVGFLDICNELIGIYDNGIWVSRRVKISRDGTPYDMEPEEMTDLYPDNELYDWPDD